MRIYKSPQVRMDGKRIDYTFIKNNITATFDGITDVFDLTNIKSSLNPKVIRTKLAINPVERIEYKGDSLEVTLISYIGADATEEERFPQAQEV